MFTENLPLTARRKSVWGNSCIAKVLLTLVMATPIAQAEDVGPSGPFSRVLVNSAAGKRTTGNGEGGQPQTPEFSCLEDDFGTDGSSASAQCKMFAPNTSEANALGFHFNGFLSATAEAKVQSSSWQAFATTTAEIFDFITVTAPSVPDDEWLLVELEFELSGPGLEISGDGGSASLSTQFATVFDSNSDSVFGEGDDTTSVGIASMFPIFDGFTTPGGGAIELPGNGLPSIPDTVKGSAAFSMLPNERVLWNMVMSTTASGFGGGDRGISDWELTISDVVVTQQATGALVEDAALESGASIDYPFNGSGGFSRLPGDFDHNGLLDALDIDLLSSAVGGTDVRFDLTSDGLVDDADRTFWVEQLKGTFFGDGDLNLTVDFVDFLNVAEQFGNDGGWAEGDFDGSGDIDFPDFLLVAENFGNTNTSSSAAAVPEPSGLLLLLIGLLALKAVPYIGCSVSTNIAK